MPARPDRVQSEQLGHADVLALLGKHRKVAPSRLLGNRALEPPAEGEHAGSQHARRDAVEEVGLVLGGVCPAAQTDLALRVGDDARVVPGGEELGATCATLLEEHPELDALVAGDTGVGSRSGVPGLVGGAHQRSELVAHIEDAVRYAERGADPACCLDGCIMLRAHSRGGESHRGAGDISARLQRAVRRPRSCPRHRTWRPRPTCPQARYSASLSSSSIA